MARSFFTLIFDPGLEGRVQRFRQLLYGAGIGAAPETRHRPHITLGGFDLADPASSAEPLRKLCSQWKPFPIRLHHIGLFPEQSVLFLEPTHTDALFAMHQAVTHELGAELATPSTSAHFAIDQWAPHCTLEVGVAGDAVGSAVRLVHEHWQPLKGIAVGIGVLVPPARIDCIQCYFPEENDAIHPDG
jgi:2'-5' RNA ligase